MKIRKLALIAIAIVALVTTIACEKLDETRIPPAQVRVAFNTQAEWEVYGTPAVLDYKTFIKSERVPSNYPYTSLTYTGFGGILLCCNLMGEPVAYDLACPVECKNNVRIKVDPDAANAYCPTCGSVYDVFNLGTPLSGPANTNGYGLKRYNVTAGSNGVYRVITN